MESNRFAPPATAVADVTLAGDVQPVRLWPPSGRIGRLRFLAYSLGFYIVFVVVAGLVGGIAGVSGASEGNFGAFGIVAILFGVVAFVLYAVGAIVLLIQRSHDMDLSGWWSIAAFIPLVGLLWVFKGGTRGINRWGAPPPPNGWAVRIFGLILPIVFVVGIIAAVAIPAFQIARTNAVSPP
jgi:uncharacterized membrane protein YhaH (DUF805 family)